MKTIVAIFLAAAVSSSFAIRLLSYNEVESAVQNGLALVVVTDFSKCQTAGGGSGPAVTGQFLPAAVMVANQAIIFSDNHFTIRNQPVNEYIKYTLKSDQSVNISTKAIKLPEYTIQSATEANCLLNQGVKFYTVSRP